MKWLNANWFKLSLVVLLFLVVLITSYYLMVFLPEQTEKAQPAEENRQVAAPAPEAQQVSNSAAATQLATFEDYLENTLVTAEINCNVYGNYMNIKYVTHGMDAATFQMAFPDSETTYQKGCSDFVMKVMNYKIISEPENQILGSILRRYSEMVTAFAVNKDWSTSALNTFSSNSKELRTAAREEILRLKRQ